MMQEPTLHEQPKSHRFPELDSLRGLAAMAVVIGHFCRVYPPGRMLTLILSKFPFRLLIEGHQAVVLFFLLSGFVLTLPYKKNRLAYKSYLTRRVCRIYLPYLVALLIAVLAAWRFHGPISRGIPLGDHWASETWSESPRIKTIVQHVLVLGDYDWTQYNTAFWSLIYEMRISLFFPFVALVVLRIPIWLSLSSAVVLSAIVRPIAVLFAPLFYLDLSPNAFLGSKFFITLHFLSIFILGAILAKNLHVLGRWSSRLSAISRTFILLVALLLYDGSVFSHFPRLLHLLDRLLLPEQAQDWGTAVGALLLVALAIEMPLFRRFLHNSAVHHLGRTSYSLYLVHGTILFIFIRFWPTPGGLGLPFLVYLMITIMATEVFYRLVEIPSMNLGRSLVKTKDRGQNLSRLRTNSSS